MPVVLVPLHFDRDPIERMPSCQRSIVLRPFVTNDFMTGVPCVPGTDKLPLAVNINFYFIVFFISLIIFLLLIDY
jgi:GMP synthase (glutamine-hydrolysing)